MCFRNVTSSFESTGLSGQDNKFKIDFQDGRNGRHLGSQWPPSWIFDRNDFLPVALILPTKFRVKRLFRSAGEV